jgi:signal transduction histidine kinase
LYHFRSSHLFAHCLLTIAVDLSQKTVLGKNNVCIRVQDTGAGIPDDKKDYIFEKFGQVCSTRTKQAEGTGIGLHLVKLLVALPGGGITLKVSLAKEAPLP